MSDYEDIMYEILFYFKVTVEAMYPMNVFNRYEYHMQNLSVRLVDPYSSYVKLTQSIRGS